MVAAQREQRRRAEEAAEKAAQDTALSAERERLREEKEEIARLRGVGEVELEGRVAWFLEKGVIQLQRHYYFTLR